MQRKDERDGSLKVFIRDKGVAFKTTFLVSPECGIDFTLATCFIASLFLSLHYPTSSSCKFEIEVLCCSYEGRLTSRPFKHEYLFEFLNCMQF
jgi:hypothetical protein